MKPLYLDITKIHQEQRVVEGIASTEALDNQPGVWDGHQYAGDVVDAEAIKAALPDYLQWANIREMHQPSAVGTALSAEVRDGKLHLAIKVVDDTAWNKVKEGVYKGFSIGGRVVKAMLEKLPDGTYIRRILKLILTEISLVDRPANPDARILLYKMEDAPMSPNDETQDTPAALDAETIAAIKKLASNGQPLAKASADPAKIVAMIQGARNELELTGDMEGAALMTQAIALVQQAAGEAPKSDEPEEVEEEAIITEGAPTDETMMIAQAAKSNLKKGTRIRTTKRLGGVEALAKNLLQLAADMGSSWAAKLIQMGSAEPTDIAQSIGTEFTKAITPIAQAVLAIHSDVELLKRQPAPGGPVLRSVEKTLATKTPTEKPQLSALAKAQIDNLEHLSRTAPTAQLRGEYKQQADALRAQYQ